MDSHAVEEPRPAHQRQMAAQSGEVAGYFHRVGHMFQIAEGPNRDAAIRAAPDEDSGGQEAD